MKDTVQLMGLLCQDQDALKEVHARSLDLIEKTGVRFHSQKALEILHGVGAEIDDDVARVPGHVIESALEKAPSSFTLYARDGQHHLDLDGTRTFYSQDGCAALTLDFETGERRASRKEDTAKMALISDYLDTIDVVSPTVSAQDMPNETMAVHELAACFVNSGKHVLTESVTSARDARAQIELAAAIAGGEDQLRREPIFSNFVCTISPLTQDAGGIEAGLEFAEAGIPVGMYPMGTTGVTSPVTLAGTMAVVNAEVTSALALLQLAVPGAPVFYSGGPASIDLRTGAYIAGSPEALWLRMMIARMAGFYNLPSIVGAGATSAKVPGAQASWENTFSFLLPSMAGASLLFGMGLLDGSNLLTYEAIVLDAEIGQIVRQLLGDVPWDEEAFAPDLIQELGPGGVYMDQLHTVQHMREALWLPTLTDRDTHDEWARKGGLDRVQVARQKVEQILATHEPPPLPDGVAQAMEDVIAAYAARD
jgi:trimethylamine--corrinoid protein Co-methyltransferase